METEHSPHSSSYSPSSPAMEIPSISDDGVLRLKGNPGTWIENNPSDSLLLVKHLQLNFNGEGNDDEEHEIGDSIERLTHLTHLTIENAILNCLPDSMVSLHNLQFLNFNHCTDLPVNLGVLKMSITHLTLYKCAEIKFLPKSLTTLSSLSNLHLKHCKSLTKLPASFGQLGSLKHVSIEYCNRLQSLPNSMANLLNLDTLSITGCSLLTKLPASLVLETLFIKNGSSNTELLGSLGQLGSLKHLSLEGYQGLESLPNSMANLLNLETLSIKDCNSLSELPDNLKITFLEIINCNTSINFNPKGLLNLHYLSLDCGYDMDVVKELVNLQNLRFQNQGFLDWRVNLDGLNELILLDIQDSTVKNLSWSITELCKLKFLMLPSDFRLGTLPSHLNESVLISVFNKHVRKTWKELKEEIGVSAIPIAQGSYTSVIAPPGYLQVKCHHVYWDLGQWIRGNYESRMQVKMLDLELPSRSNVEATKKSIRELPYLTHLFLTGNGREDCLPRTIRRLKHVCLKSCHIKSRFGGLSKLSNLETLDLIDSECAEITYLPASLRRLSLQSLSIYSLPDSLAKLSSLHTLELRDCYKLDSLPPMNIVTLKIDRIIKPLPIGVRNLEILHAKSDHCDEYCDGDKLEHCLTRMVNLKMLSFTCDRIKSFPSMARQRKLQVLILKDCFSLKELMPDMEQLIKLHTLNISGTRIKSLPNSIMRLSILQQLTLPKCFTQKLPRNLEEVSIIDDTDERYYKYMDYYDCGYDAITDSSCKGNAAAVGSIEGVDEALTEDHVQGVNDEPAYEQDGFIAQISGGCSSYNQDVKMHYISENSQQALQNEGLGTMTEKNEQENVSCDTVNIPCGEETEDNQSALEIGQHMFLLSDNAKSKTQKLDLPQDSIQPLLSKKTRLENAAKRLRVLRYILKRRKEYGITWPSSKRRKPCHDAEGEPNTDSSRLEKPSTPAGHGHELKSSKGATTARMETVKKPLMKAVKENHIDIPQHVEDHLDGTNQSNIALRSGSSSSFDFVKACYEGDPVWIDFSLTSNIDQLKESVCKKFGLEVNKFKIKYLDDDKEWLLMTCVSDLTHALLHTSLSGRKFVRLSITDTRVRNTGRT